MHQRALSVHKLHDCLPNLPGTALLALCLWHFPANAQTVDSPAPAYQFDAAVDGELWRNQHGGLRTGNRFLTHGLASLAIDGNSAFGTPGLDFYSAALFTNGRSINDELVGSAQGISNIEAPSGLRLYELWAQWQYAADHSLRVGLYDVNAEFDAIDTACLFINPSHGIGADFSQSGQNGPSIFPSTSLAVRSAHQFGRWTVQLAALDGVPGDPEHPSHTRIEFNRNDGVLWLAETAYATESGLRAAAGYWRYSADFEDLLAVDDNGDALQRNDNQGYYALLDVSLRQAQNNQTAVSAYLRAGKANAHINAIGTYVGGGIVLSGVLPHRNDQLGMAVGMARAGDPYREAQTAQGQATAQQEVITELTYFVPVTEWLSLQPDIQHVQHAGFSSEVRDAWIFGLRFELTLSMSK